MFIKRPVPKASSSMRNSSKQMNKAERDKPLTSEEKKKLIKLMVGVPWLVYAPLVYAGALFRTWPELSPIFVGLWLTPIAASASYVASWMFLRDCPAIVRERLHKSEFTGGDKSQEPPKEHTAQRLLAISLSLPIFISGYESAGRMLRGDPDLPMVIHAAGAILLVSSTALIGWVLRYNQYAAKVVYKQEGHQLVTTGPYSFVRHPFYTFMIPLSIGWPWVMGSLAWGLIPSLMTIPILMWRTCHEEEFLLHEFSEDYKRYRKDVPSRMFPGVFWCTDRKRLNARDRCAKEGMGSDGTLTRPRIGRCKNKDNSNINECIHERWRKHCNQ